jgi:hypothetical protein
MAEHRLRYMVHSESSEITDEELNELEEQLPMDDYLDSDSYEYSGNFILTKYAADRDEAMTHMCCGIMSKDVTLKSGEEIYLAFDYGH